MKGKQWTLTELVFQAYTLLTHTFRAKNMDQCHQMTYPWSSAWAAGDETMQCSLAWPDPFPRPFRVAAYQLEIISATLQRSMNIKTFDTLLVSITWLVNKLFFKVSSGLSSAHSEVRDCVSQFTLPDHWGFSFFFNRYFRPLYRGNYNWFPIDKWLRGKGLATWD